MSKKETKNKMFVLDTSSIIQNYKCIEELGTGGNVVVIPYHCLRELDVHSKSKISFIRDAARNADRILENLREKGKIYSDPKSALENAVASFNNGGKVAWYAPTKEDVEYSTDVIRGEEDDVQKDDYILITSLSIKNKFPEMQTKLITEDINFRLRASVFKIEAEKLRLGKLAIKNPDELYSGYEELFVDKKIIDEFMASGPDLEKYISLKKFSKKNLQDLIYNQGIKLIDEKQNNICILATVNMGLQRLESLKHAVYFDNKNNYEHDVMRIKPKPVFGIVPGDERQILYMEHLLNPNIHLIAVNGRFGTGKTRLMMAGSLENLYREFRKKDVGLQKNAGYINGIVFLRPEYISSEYDPGYLPGTLEEKIDPYLKPYRQAIAGLSKKSEDEKFINYLEEEKLLRGEATSFLRGQDYSDVIVCADEMQNGSSSFAILFLSRMGEGTKTIVSGDLSQIDNKYVDYDNNSLALITEAIHKESSPNYAAITLTKNYRKGTSRLTETLFNMLSTRREK